MQINSIENFLIDQCSPFFLKGQRNKGISEVDCDFLPLIRKVSLKSRKITEQPKNIVNIIYE